jgi:energy-converting hydrogenase Eha subunit H
MSFKLGAIALILGATGALAEKEFMVVQGKLIIVFALVVTLDAVRAWYNLLLQLRRRQWSSPGHILSSYRTAVIYRNKCAMKLFHGLD